MTGLSATSSLVRPRASSAMAINFKRPATAFLRLCHIFSHLTRFARGRLLYRADIWSLFFSLATLPPALSTLATAALLGAISSDTSTAIDHTDVAAVGYRALAPRSMVMHSPLMPEAQGLARKPMTAATSRTSTKRLVSCAVRKHATISSVLTPVAAA